MIAPYQPVSILLPSPSPVKQTEEPVRVLPSSPHRQSLLWKLPDYFPTLSVAFRRDGLTPASILNRKHCRRQMTDQRWMNIRLSVPMPPQTIHLRTPKMTKQGLYTSYVSPETGAVAFLQRLVDDCDERIQPSQPIRRMKTL